MTESAQSPAANTSQEAREWSALSVEDLWALAEELTASERAQALAQVVANHPPSVGMPAADAVLLEWLSFPAHAGWDGMLTRLNPVDLEPWLEIIDRLVIEHGANVNTTAWARSPTFTSERLTWASPAAVERPDGPAGRVLVPARTGRAAGRGAWLFPDVKPGTWVNALGLAVWQKPPAFVARLLAHGATAWPDLERPSPPSDLVRMQRKSFQASAPQRQREATASVWSALNQAQCLLSSPPPRVPPHVVSEELVGWAKELVQPSNLLNKFLRSHQFPAFLDVGREWLRRAQQPGPQGHAYGLAVVSVGEVLGAREVVEQAPDLLDAWEQLRVAHRLENRLPCSESKARPRL